MEQTMNHYEITDNPTCDTARHIQYHIDLNMQQQEEYVVYMETKKLQIDKHPLFAQMRENSRRFDSLIDMRDNHLKNTYPEFCDCVTYP